MTDTFAWTDERVRRLRALWDEGRPASQIAAAMGCTRSAVIGKAHRIGCPPRPSPIAGTARPLGAAVRRMPRADRPAWRPKRETVQAARAAALAEAPSVPDARAIWDPHDPRQEPRGCRFIHGHPCDPGWRFCQAPAAGEGSWCAVHRAVVFRPDPAEAADARGAAA